MIACVINPLLVAIQTNDGEEVSKEKYHCIINSVKIEWKIRNVYTLEYDLIYKRDWACLTHLLLPIIIRCACAGIEGILMLFVKWNSWEELVGNGTYIVSPAHNLFLKQIDWLHC